MLESYQDLFEQAIPEEGPKYVLQGARELVSELTKNKHLLVLYTENPAE